MAVLKNVNPGGIAQVPSAYKIEEVTITNAEGVAINIRPIVRDIEIIESMYSSTMMCKVTLLDESNIAETLPIYGLETVYIHITRIEGSKDKNEGNVEEEGDFHEIERLFYVTDYPLFGRARREKTQVWTVSGVSFHAWKNPLMRISRGYAGPISDEIVKIAEDAFGLETLVKGGPITEGQGIINIQSPLQAIEWFRRRLYEADGCPFYFYEHTQLEPNEILLESHSSIAGKAPYETYTDSRDFNVEVATPEDYEARVRRMVDVTSMLKLSKIVPAREGSFGSENNFLDLATKTFFKRYYDYEGKFPIGKTIHGTNILKAPPDFNFEGKFEPGGGSPSVFKNEENLNGQFYAHMEHMSLNSEAYLDSDLQNYMQFSHDQIDVLNAFPGVFNTLMHEVTIHGDFELNPGKVVELKFPKAADPAQTGIRDLIDNNLSGKYIVISTIHRFKDQEYYTSFRAKRDSFSE